MGELLLLRRHALILFRPALLERRRLCGESRAALGERALHLVQLGLSRKQVAHPLDERRLAFGDDQLTLHQVLLLRVRAGGLRTQLAVLARDPLALRLQLSGALAEQVLRGCELGLAILEAR